MNRPRIALIAASLDILGGQGVQAQLLVNRLRAEGYSVELLPINPALLRGMQWIRHVPYLRTIITESLYAASLRKLRQYDIVHVFTASYWSFLLVVLPALMAAKALGKPLLLNYHSGEADDHLRRWGALVHPWLRAMDSIVVPSQFLKGVFARHGYAVKVVPNAIDLSRFVFRRRELIRPLLLSNRNLESHYSVETTIEAFSILKSSFPHARLVIAGYGTLEKQLRKVADGIPDVEFVGRIEPSKMPKLYDKNDVFVNSSVIDNQPLSLVEAFASGIPVVTTPTGDIRAMVREGETGLFFPHAQPDALARRIRELLGSPSLVRHLTENARTAARAYSWENVRHQWDAIYQEMC